MALTNYKEGSVRELWSLSFPLMLSALSVLTMVFSDRWLLAHYSTEAHNAAVGATTFAWSFIFGWMSLTGISEVFVAQYNGAGLRHKLGEPVWQTIWISFSSFFFFIPLSYWAPDLLFGSGQEAALERDYFSIMVLFGPFYAFYSSLCGFFVAQGKTGLITKVVVTANLVNIFMDWVLIFGIEGWIPSMGVKGAAIATSFAMLFQGLVLSLVFLGKKYRKDCGTALWKPKVKTLMECVKIGLPVSLFIVIELLAFGCYYLMMKEKGMVYITVAGICQGMFVLFIFFGEGIHKATAAIVGNLIGAGRSFFIPQVMKAGIVLNVIFLAFVMTFFLLGESLIISIFLPQADPEFIVEIRQSLQISLFLYALLLFFECLRMQFSGILTASGDTIFLLVCGVVLVWVCMWLPVYLLIAKGTAPVEIGALIGSCYSGIVCLAYFWRIRHNQKKTIAALECVNSPS